MQLRAGRKLSENALFRIKSRKRLAEVLLVSIAFIQTANKMHDGYRRLWKPKKSEGPWLKYAPSTADEKSYRPIDLAVPELKRVQARIAKLLSSVETPEFLFSPVKGRSYVDNAAAHIGAVAFWMLDIQSYFPSCRQERVAWFFRVKMECAPDVAAILAQLACHLGALPQGSPCSPILSYFSNMDMWTKISKCAAEHGCTISVYADDITLSGSVVPKALVWDITAILFSNGFTLAAEKGHSRINQPADITGVIVDGNTLKVANRQLMKLRDLRNSRPSVLQSNARRVLENRIAGSVSQHRQITEHQL